MKRLKLFPKTFFYTLTIMVFVIVIAHILIYLLAPQMGMVVSTADNVAEEITIHIREEKIVMQYKGYVGQIENTLKAHQAYVGGMIQAVHLTPEIIVICNDEGKIQQLPLNRARIDNDQVIDYFVGNILCVRHLGEEFASIEPEDIPIIERLLVPLKSMFQAG